MNYAKIKLVDRKKASNKIFDLRSKHINMHRANIDFAK